jgi:hypothetical protein
VVNGGAELNICCDYWTTVTESGGHIKFSGAIDIPDINREIADVIVALHVNLDKMSEPERETFTA